MYIKAATRTRLTTSLFSTTFLIAVFTVTAPQFLPCPAHRDPVGADAKKSSVDLVSQKVSTVREEGDEVQNDKSSSRMRRFGGRFRMSDAFAAHVMAKEESAVDWNNIKVVIMP